MNQVQIARPQNPYKLSGQQTAGDYNYNQASAYYQGDPRYAAKQYQRGGVSSSKGTAALGAAEAANSYAKGMTAAEVGRMQDAYSNANLSLSDASQRSDFGLALAGLQEDAAQRQYTHNMRNMQGAMNFTGNLFGSSSPAGGGNASSVLAGLY